MKKTLIAIAVLATATVAFGEAQDAASRERNRLLIDTNAATTVTAYTASAAGQMLVGKVSGTNAIWIATAAGTNGWVKAVQAP